MSRIVQRAARSGAVLLIALGLLAGALTLAPAEAVPTGTDHPGRARATDLLDRIASLFDRPGSAIRTAPEKVDLTLLLNELRQSLPALTGADRTRAKGLLARPFYGAGDNLCSPSDPCYVSVPPNSTTTQNTAHFSIHYQSSVPLLGQDQRPPSISWVNTVATVLEEVYTKELTNLGFKTPLSDVATSNPGDKGNPDGLIDVFLADTGRYGIYGYASSDDYSSAKVAPFFVLDNDFAPGQFGGAAAINSLKVTVAHEFFHGVQYGYDATEDPWFLEGTAVWMEDIVYPAVNDYLQYLAVSQVKQPRIPTNYNGGLYVYGAVTFFKFLSERFKDPNIIRQVWNAADASGSRTGIQAVGAVLAARGYSFAPEFARYALWNTLPPRTYGDRALWLKRVSPGAWLSTTLSRSRRDTKVRKVGLNHLSSAPLVVRPGAGVPTRTKLRIYVDAPNSSHGSRATFQVRLKSGAVKLYTVGLNAKGNAVRQFGFNPRYVRSGILIVSNASTGYNAQTFAVRARLIY